LNSFCSLTPQPYFAILLRSLGADNVCRLEAFGALQQVKLHGLTLIERAVAVLLGGDGTMLRIADAIAAIAIGLLATDEEVAMLRRVDLNAKRGQVRSTRQVAREAL